MRIIRVVLIVLGVFVSRANAGLYGWFPLRDLVKDATAIIIGRAELPSNPTTALLAIDVRSSLKGEPKVGSIVYAKVTANLPPNQVGPAKAYGIWFLKGSAPEWELMPIAGGDITVNDLYYSSDPTQNELVSVRQEAIDVADHIVVGLNKASNKSKLSFLGNALFGSSSPLIKNLYISASKATDNDVRLFGLVGLLRDSDRTALLEVENEARKGSSIVLAPELLVALDSIYRDSSAESIAALNRIVTSTANHADLRQSAATALMALHTEEAVPALTQLLEAESPELQYRAVFGLASFANNYPIQTPANVASMGYISPLPAEWVYRTKETMTNVPSWEAFQKDSIRYLNFWKNWSRAFLGMQ